MTSVPTGSGASITNGAFQSFLVAVLVAAVAP